MAHVRFIDDFDYRIPDTVATHTAYKAGMTCTVKKDCADKAVAAGKAVRVKPPRTAAIEDGKDA